MQLNSTKRWRSSPKSPCEANVQNPISLTNSDSDRPTLVRWQKTLPTTFSSTLHNSTHDCINNSRWEMSGSRESSATPVGGEFSGWKWANWGSFTTTFTRDLHPAIPPTFHPQGKKKKRKFGRVQLTVTVAKSSVASLNENNRTCAALLRTSTVAHETSATPMPTTARQSQLTESQAIMSN